MKLGKRIGSAALAFLMGFTMIPENIPKSMAESAAVQSTQTTEPKKEIESAQAEEITAQTEIEAKEDAVKITDMTIASTYYSTDGKFPIYVEYKTDKTVGWETCGNWSLRVTKEDGTRVADYGSYGFNGTVNYFYVPECQNIQNGESSKLKFSVIDTSSGEEKIIYETEKQVSFQDKNIWTRYSYLPMKSESCHMEFYIASGSALTSGDRFNVYLLDQEGNVAAGAEYSMYISDYSIGNIPDTRYQDIFENNSLPLYMTGWRLDSSFYYAREPKVNEKLYMAYSLNNEMYSLKDIVMTVTDKPIVMMNYRNDTQYPGEENAMLVQVSGSQIDFEKLSLKLKEKESGKIVGNSVSSVVTANDTAGYTVKWNEESLPENKNYEIEYSYIDNTEVLVQGDKTIYYYGNSSQNSVWNPKTDSIEYYNKQIPIGSKISYEVLDYMPSVSGSSIYASGSDIQMGDQHLAIIPLKETFVESGTYRVDITYIDKDNIVHGDSFSVFIYKNKATEDEKEPYTLTSGMLEQTNYLEGDSYEFSVRVFCNDKSKLNTTCDAVIRDMHHYEKTWNIKLLMQEGEYGESYYYKGTCSEALPIGRYQLSFQPDGNITCSYIFYINSKETLSLTSQQNNIDLGSITLYCSSLELRDWYFSEENLKELEVKICDIRNQERGTYKLSKKDFSIEYNGALNQKVIKFSDTMKKDLENLYFCYVYIHYNGKEVLGGYEPSRSLYEYNISAKRYSRSQKTSSLFMNSLSSYKGRLVGGSIYGSESVFPAKLTITDWYSIKPLKTISIPSTGYYLSEADLDGLSLTKLYNCYLVGADGTVATAIYAYLQSTIGNPFWTSFSDIYKVSGDFDVTLKFTNKGSGLENFHNYILCFANAFSGNASIPSQNEDYKEYYILRADAWGWSAKGSNVTLEGNLVEYKYDWDWNQFRTMMTNAKVTMNIKRTGNDFVVDAKILGSDEKEYTYTVKFTTQAEKDMSIFLTSEQTEISDLSFTDNKKTQTGDNTGNNTGSNTGNNTGSNTGNGGSSFGGSTNTNNNSNTEDKKEDNTNTSTDTTPSKEDITPSQNTTIETRPDGTKVETTTEIAADGSKKETVVETKTDGGKREIVTETKTDGSATETKKVTVGDRSATLQAVTQKDTNGNGNTNAVIRTGVTKQGTIEIPKELLEDALASGKLESLVVEISGETITGTTIKKANTVLNVKIPDVENAIVDSVVLTKDSIQAVKNIGKSLKVTIENGLKDSYIVSIPAKQLAKLNTSIEKLDLTVNAENAGNVASEKSKLVKAITKSKGKEKKACIISIAENEAAKKAGLKVTISVTEKANVAEGSKVYVYKYNKNTGKLEETARSKQTITGDGTVSIEAVSGTDYIVSAKKLSGKNVETIKDNIEVSLTKNTIKIGKKGKVVVDLPKTVSLKKKFGAEKAVITYKSSNSRIASVSSKGTITAKKKGKVNIRVNIKLESGQKITQKQTITIR